MTTTTEPAPDHPPVPRSKLSSGVIALAVFGALVTGGYAALAYTDYEPGSPAREEVPASVRSSPGGYRSFHFWHSGYHGGK
ncbi:MAG: hypothetical protein ABIY55_11130 [Kofleriaceae bacterium]